MTDLMIFALSPKEAVIISKWIHAQPIRLIDGNTSTPDEVHNFVDLLDEALEDQIDRTQTIRS